jgi:hypothetical protein
MGDKKVTFKFDKSVDSGPLPEGETEETQQTIQNERIRRQVASRIGPKPNKTKEALKKQLMERSRRRGG